MVDGKEAHVFDHPAYATQANKTAFANEIYRIKLSNYQAQPIVCDATPITVFQPDFVQACYQSNPKAKFILILRDPVERAISHYRMSLTQNHEHRSMLSAFLKETSELRGINKNRPWKFDSPFRNHSYLSRGCYSKQLRHVYSTIPKKQVLVLHQQTLKIQHKATMHKIFKFLEVDDFDTIPSQIFRSEKTNVSRNDFLAKVYAKCYFFVRRENLKKWNEIINS